MRIATSCPTRPPVCRLLPARALPDSLTNEQAEAVATDEDVTLVLAGAGTGKTSVIVGKVAHLVRNEGVSPDEILVLAFNRKAAAEIVARLRGDLSSAHVRTFHGFGRRVIADVEKTNPTISQFVGEHKLPGALKDILKELLDDPQESDATASFIASYGRSLRIGLRLRTPRMSITRTYAVSSYRTMSGDTGQEL